MTPWPELVTTALLGTARRGLPTADVPPPGAAPRDPALALLDLAATSRAARLAGRLPAVDDSPIPEDPGPALPPAPAAAGAVLTELLERPDPTLVNLWLAACAAHDRGAPPELWTRLAAVAARSTAYDRATLAQVLGPPGRWFLRQNAAWRRLAESAEAQRSSPPAPPEGGPVVLPEAVRRAPEMIFARPQPWPPEVAAAALDLLGGTSLGAGRRSYAALLGAELPLTAYPLISAAAERSLDERPAPLAQRRLARECFVACEVAAWTRIRIRDAFDPPDSPTERREIPPLHL